MKLMMTASQKATKEACGDKGTAVKTAQTMLDAVDTQLKTLTDCKESVLCEDMTAESDDKKEEEHSDDDGHDHKKCCLAAMGEMNMMGAAFKLCDPFTATLKTLTAEEKTAAETAYKAS